jgi:predicted Rossmann fold nucleotide-binding protein DprA/Smf involved in DNA uptake
MKIAIIGSREWSNTRKIKELLSSLKQKFGDELVIISGGAKDGADAYVKKYAIEFGLNYQEYNPAHTQRNLYSVMPDSYYSKPYHVTQFHHRNMLIAKACDRMIALVPGEVTKGTASAIKYAKKLDKPVVILS